MEINIFLVVAGFIIGFGSVVYGILLVIQASCPYEEDPPPNESDESVADV